MADPQHVLLAGVVGSTAYGLAGPAADVDRLGVFAAPTIAFHGLRRPRESIVSTGPEAPVEQWLHAVRGAYLPGPAQRRDLRPSSAEVAGDL